MSNLFWSKLGLRSIKDLLNFVWVKELIKYTLFYFRRLLKQINEEKTAKEIAKKHQPPLLKRAVHKSLKRIKSVKAAKLAPTHNFFQTVEAVVKNSRNTNTSKSSTVPIPQLLGH